MQDIEKTIQSQYAHSPTLVSLIKGLNALLDMRKNEELFYSKYYNPLTAEGAGLDIWGKIVGIARGVQVEDTDIFGFNGQDLNGFDYGNFYIDCFSKLFVFDDKSYRLLILLKSAINTSRCDAQSINSLFANLFKEKKAYVLEIYTMHIRFVFEFALTDYERAIIERLKLMPRPSGVSFEYYEIEPETTFGFDGSHLQGFDTGSFAIKGATAVEI